MTAKQNPTNDPSPTSTANPSESSATTGQPLAPAEKPAPAWLQRLASDQGDVPGWVLITLMTAAIVLGLWAVASEQLIQIFNSAMEPFLNGPGGQ